MLRRKSLGLLMLGLCLLVASAPRSLSSQTAEVVSVPSLHSVQPASASTVVAQSEVVLPHSSLRTPDVIYVPTPPEVVAEMLRMAKIRPWDVLYDLGSGDGRIAIAAARQYGIRAVGIDISPQRIAEANENARAAGVASKVRFILGDLFQADISEATVVTLYLLDSLNEKLRPKLLRELQPRTRIVSHAFRMGDWQPQKEAEVNGRMIYFWTVPARAAAR